MTPPEQTSAGGAGSAPPLHTTDPHHDPSLPTWAQLRPFIVQDSHSRRVQITATCAALIAAYRAKELPFAASTVAYGLSWAIETNRLGAWTVATLRDLPPRLFAGLLVDLARECGTMDAVWRMLQSAPLGTLAEIGRQHTAYDRRHDPVPVDTAAETTADDDDAENTADDAEETEDI